MIRSIFLALVCTVLPTVLYGQADPDSVKLRNDCRLADQVLTTGNPAPHREWALGVIWLCPRAGSTLSNALRTATATTDTSYLDALTAPAIELRDGDLFSAAMSVAGNPSASVPARVFAIRTLIYTARPGGSVDYDRLVADDPRVCLGSSSPHSSVRSGTPLPSDYVEQMRALANRTFRDGTQPKSVRQAAECVLFAVGRSSTRF